MRNVLSVGNEVNPKALLLCHNIAPRNTLQVSAG